MVSYKGLHGSWYPLSPGAALGLLTLLLLLCLLESVIGNCMERGSPGQAMELPDHNGLGYPARPLVSEHLRSRTLQRHHTIQNSDDAYVCRPSCCVEVGWCQSQPESTVSPSATFSEASPLRAVETFFSLAPHNRPALTGESFIHFVRLRNQMIWHPGS